MQTDVRVDPTGLSTNEAQERLKRYSSNEIKHKNKLRPALILLQQFTSPLILILIVAAMLSLSLSYLPGQADHITDAIRQGRTIFSNIRKFIDYLLTCNIAEVLVIFFATLFFELEGPVLLAVQILWINLLTDGLVALSLGADPPANDIMTHPPRRPNEPLINRHLAWLIGLIGVKKMIILLILFWLALPLGLDSARTVLLTGFVVFEFVRIGVIRYGEQLGWLDNKWLIGALLLSLSLHLMIVYTPLNTFFSLVPLGSYEWLLLVVGAFLGYLLAILITRLLMFYVPNG